MVDQNNKNNEVYIIGEIGQNHNGSVDIAKLIVDLVHEPIKDDLFHRELKGIDAIKLTKRDLAQEISATQWKQEYNSPHAFGKTYGEHREALELSDEEHADIATYAKSQGLDVIETLCAVGNLNLLKLFTPDYLKVASRDLTNLPLLEAMAETKIPMILSLGMGAEKELDQALNIINKHHENISILHCVSQYPTDYKNLNLLSIAYLLKHYSKYTIGFSDHTIGISTPVAAVAMGAKIIEKHVTINRNMKGSDQAGSLGPEGVHRMVRDIRNIEISMGKEGLFVEEDVRSAKVKLERSIATMHALKEGDIISKDDLQLLSPGDGFKWSELDQVVGKKLKKNIPANEVIYLDMLV